MPRKRKNTTCPVPRVKRRKKAFRLLDLPTELLHLILRYVLPDPADTKHSANLNIAVELFTHPVLRTSTTIRKEALDMMRCRDLWIDLRIPNRSVILELGYTIVHRDCHPVKHLPVFPIQFCSYFDAKRPAISFKFSGNVNSWSGDCSRGIEDIAFIFPYSFLSIVKVCEILSSIADLDNINGGTIEFYNIHGHFRNLIDEFFIPALSNLRSLDYVYFIDDGRLSQSMYPVDQIIPREPNLRELMFKTKFIVEQADKLHDKGHLDEYGLLLEASNWIRIEAGSMLPKPGAWAMGEVDATAIRPDDRHEPFFEGRNPEGNALRQLLQQLECKACLAHTRLLEHYGFGWCYGLEPLFGGDFPRFIIEPHFSWFGLATKSLAEICYSRARLCQTTGRHFLNGHHSLPEQRDLSEEERSHLLQLSYELQVENTIQYMYYASMLDPKNEKYRAGYKHACGIVKGEQRRYMQECARQKFILIANNSSKPVWAGPWDMVKDWAGELHAIEWLPLAQKGIDISPPFEEYLENFTHRQRTWWLKQGRMLKAAHREVYGR